jgi:hypothetical protein
MKKNSIFIYEVSGSLERAGLVANKLEEKGATVFSISHSNTDIGYNTILISYHYVKDLQYDVY